jgi:hypothetical protein
VKAGDRSFSVKISPDGFIMPGYPRLAAVA